MNFWTLSVPDQLLQKYQNKQIAGLSKQRHQIGFRKITSRQEKTWERTKLSNRGKIITQKPETWRIQIAGQDKFMKGSDSEIVLLACYCVNAQLGFQKCFVQTNSWGRWNAAASGKNGRFWCFLAQEIQKTFFPKWGSAQFEFLNSSNPPLPHP